MCAHAIVPALSPAASLRAPWSCEGGCGGPASTRGRVSSGSCVQAATPQAAGPGRLCRLGCGPWACILCSDCEPLLFVLLVIALEEQTTLFKPAPAGRRLGCFQVRGVVFKAAVTIWVQAVGTCLFSSVITGHRGGERVSAL